MGTEPILVNAELAPSQQPPKHVEREIQTPPVNGICYGCSRHHGSVGEELQCLRRELSGARVEMDRLREVVLRFSPK